MDEKIRAFVAISVPAEAKQELVRVGSTLRPYASQGVRWVQPDSIHLTLKFLGEIETSLVPSVLEAMQSASSGIRPFELHLSQVGAFPNWNVSRVLWVGLNGELETLLKLQKFVEENLVRLGFPREEHTFSPHLTVARARQPLGRHDATRLKEAAERLVIEAHGWTVRSIELMESTLMREGAIYTKLGEIGL